MYGHKNSYLEIHRAVLQNNYRKVRNLLRNKVSPNKQTRNKNTPLHIATMLKHHSIIKLLQSHSANPNLQNLHGSTPLHIAAYKKNNLEALNLLLNMGADVNKTDRYGNTALHIAASNSGNTKALQALLKAGANPSRINNDFETALSIAKRNKHTTYVDLLTCKWVKLQKNILRTLKQSFHATPIFKKIALITFSIAVFSATITISIVTPEKTFMGIVLSMLATLGMSIVCLEEQYYKLQKIKNINDDG